MLLYNIITFFFIYHIEKKEVEYYYNWLVYLKHTLFILISQELKSAVRILIHTVWELLAQFSFRME